MIIHGVGLYYVIIPSVVLYYDSSLILSLLIKLWGVFKYVIAVDGGLMRGWGVLLDCGVRECSNITLCFKEQWDWYRWTGVYQIRVQTLHNKPFGMRVNGHGTSCY